MNTGINVAGWNLNSSIKIDQGTNTWRLRKRSVSQWGGAYIQSNPPMVEAIEAAQ
tara:strand:+ start:422 stop:586 length:165 start_codon:yes stop_codon:yes gene_type:complete